MGSIARLRSPTRGVLAPGRGGWRRWPLPRAGTELFGPLAHPLLFAFEVGDELLDVLASPLVGRAGADDLGGPPDVGQGLPPAAELVGWDPRGLVAEPVAFPGKRGDIGDRLFGAVP